MAKLTAEMAKNDMMIVDKKLFLKENILVNFI